MSLSGLEILARAYTAEMEPYRRKRVVFVEDDSGLSDDKDKPAYTIPQRVVDEILLPPEDRLNAV